MASFNDQIIEEFRANEGRVGGMFEGAPLLLLTTTGRKSGEPRVSPLVHSGAADGDGYVIAASKAGADTHPAWFLNIQADPAVRVEVGTETFGAHARIAGPEERDRLWEAHVATMPNFRDYEKATSRVIPMVVLERE
ncbi:nitroreductase family deazaflavin-dependent oxidoreductase [Capillimicrobium parvum]|uniref:Deazaflavin-dependent nitroreductase n=1 Tax=Capillimicrobium parvum TaxID=2884022 RepID=A0A9E6Y0G4_9ACTN|nr:nitroreductase family deazaflavin-dependent oxidoreductase [Capillimicrobium parvum]UGS37357.1 Deazaflavin-dependent nitroreductase [Capillimicrobium parvum]